MKKRFILTLLIMIAILSVNSSFAAYNLGYGGTGTTHICSESISYRTDGTNHWKACSTCGKPIGIKIQHTLTYKSTDNTYHWSRCTICSELGAMEMHMGGTSTNGGKCTVCMKEYVTQHKCVPSTSYTTDGTHHWKICSTAGCGKMAGVKGSHTGGTATNGGKCAVCPKVYVAQQHRCLPAMGYSTDSDFHWKQCATPDCNRIVVIKSPHTAGTSTNGGACNVCGMVYVKQVAAPHVCIGQENYAASDQYHWKVCTVPGCQKLVMKETAHTGGTSTNGGECEVCGQPYVTQAIAHECVAGAPKNGDYKGWNVNAQSHFLNCKECGREMNGTYHHGSLPKDGNYICAECGYPFAPATCLHADAELVKFDDDSHFRLCKDCGMVLDSDMPHSFISAVEGDYCPCGYTIPHVCVPASTYSKDAKYHWKVCIGTNCKQILEYARNHSGGTVNNGNCTVCGYQYVEQTSLHKCTASAEYKADAYFHWKNCAGCGEIMGRGYHIGGTLANGGKCMICKIAYPVKR